MREKINGNFCVMIFPKYGYNKYHREIYFKTLLYQNQIDYFRLCDLIQKNMYWYDAKIVWTIQAFRGCIDTSMR